MVSIIEKKNMRDSGCSWRIVKNAKRFWRYV